MSRLAGIGLLVLLWAARVGGALPFTLTASWDANPPADGVLYYTIVVDASIVGTTTGTSFAFQLTTPGLHEISVTAFDGAHTSTPSTVQAFCTPTTCAHSDVPSAPTGLQITTSP
jgi:hypothetical protein